MTATNTNWRSRSGKSPSSSCSSCFRLCLCPSSANISVENGATGVSPLHHPSFLQSITSSLRALCFVQLTAHLSRYYAQFLLSGSSPPLPLLRRADMHRYGHIQEIVTRLYLVHRLHGRPCPRALDKWKPFTPHCIMDSQHPFLPLGQLIPSCSFRRAHNCHIISVSTESRQTTDARSTWRPPIPFNVRCALKKKQSIDMHRTRNKRKFVMQSTLRSRMECSSKLRPMQTYFHGWPYSCLQRVASWLGSNWARNSHRTGPNTRSASIGKARVCPVECRQAPDSRE